MTPEEIELDRKTREFARGLLERGARLQAGVGAGILHILQPEAHPAADLESLSSEERALVEGVYADFRRLMESTGPQW